MASTRKSNQNRLEEKRRKYKISESVDVECPNCGEHQGYTKEMQGRHTCGNCGTVFIVDGNDVWEERALKRKELSKGLFNLKESAEDTVII